jgi:hypothetical protein
MARFTPFYPDDGGLWFIRDHSLPRTKPGEGLARVKGNGRLLSYSTEKACRKAVDRLNGRAS